MKNCWLALVATIAANASAMQTDIPAPSGGVTFGHSVHALPNGNFIVTDPDAEGTRGAVHLYSAEGMRISTLRGAAPGDKLGNDGILVLPRGDFLVCNPSTTVGVAQNAGSVTWVDGLNGRTDVVSPLNSLLGTQPDDRVGESCRVTKDGNALVLSPHWSREVAGLQRNAGAATWIPASGGVTGALSAANSLVGRSTDDQVGAYAVEVTFGGGVVLGVPHFSLPGRVAVGAAVYMDTATGMTGEIDNTNALLGFDAGDAVGSAIFPTDGVTYYVLSPGWHGTVGALTRCLPRGPCNQRIEASNSLVGVTPGDLGPRTTALPFPDGKLLLQMPDWSDPVRGTTHAGATLVLPANQTTTGSLDRESLLFGYDNGDHFGKFAVLLDNGNAVVWSDETHINGEPNGAAVVFTDKDNPVSGPVLLDKALCTTTGNTGNTLKVIPLSRGQYVVACPDCAIDQVPSAGAVVWSSAQGTTGWIESSNSLHGSRGSDSVGSSVTVLQDGGYVVASPQWDRAALLPNAGAVTYVNMHTGWPQHESSRGAAVSERNSMIGKPGDRLGSGGIIDLGPAYDYAILSPEWTNSFGDRVGAVTSVDAGGNPGNIGGRVGDFDEQHSLFGLSDGDRLGASVSILQDRVSMIIDAPSMDIPGPGTTIEDAGASVWISKYGLHHWLRRQLSDKNAFFGASAGDHVGRIQPLPSGEFAVWAPDADRCAAGSTCIADVGAWTVAPDGTPFSGRLIPSRDTFFGTIQGEGATQNMSFNEAAHILVIGRPAANKVTLFMRDTIFASSFE